VVEAFALAMLFVLREYLIYRICRLLVFANAVQCSRTSSGATNGLPALTSTGMWSCASIFASVGVVARTRSGWNRGCSRSAHQELLRVTSRWGGRRHAKSNESALEPPRLMRRPLSN